MSMRNFIWVMVGVVALLVIFGNARLQFNSAKKETKEQHLKDAFVTVTAPALEKKSLNEESIKETQKDMIHEVAVYGVFYKKAEYSLIYTYYKQEADLQEHMQGIKMLFDGKNFQYEASGNDEGNGDRARLSGTFEINGKKFSTEVLLLKQGLRFWQFLAVFPESESNKEAALNYVNSVKIDDTIEDNTPEKK